MKTLDLGRFAGRILSLKPAKSVEFVVPWESFELRRRGFELSDLLSAVNR